MPFETATVTLVLPLGDETNVVFSVAGTVDSPGPTGGDVTGPGGTDVIPGVVTGGTGVLKTIVCVLIVSITPGVVDTTEKVIIVLHVTVDLLGITDGDETDGAGVPVLSDSTGVPRDVVTNGTDVLVLGETMGVPGDVVTDGPGVFVVRNDFGGDKVNGGIEIWLDESDTVKDDNGDDPDTLLDFVMVTRDSERLDRGLSLIELVVTTSVEGDFVIDGATVPLLGGTIEVPDDVVTD